MAEFAEHDRLVGVEIEEGDAPPPSADLEQERRVAVYDLLERNRFRLCGQDAPAGPYRLRLGFAPEGWRFDTESHDGERVGVPLAAEPLAPLLEDYLALCETYRDAVRRLAPSQIESAEQARRALHMEASAQLRESLDGRIEMDEETARRLFTVLCALGPVEGAGP